MVGKLVEYELIFQPTTHVKDDLSNSTIGNNCKILGYAGRSKWYVKCHCGEIFVRYTTDILGNESRKAIKECIKCSYKTRGINRKINKTCNGVRKDLTGVPVGKLGYVVRHSHKQKWEVMCGDCNNLFITTRGAINGNKKRTPITECKKCSGKRRGLNEKKQMLGRRFGRLVVHGFLSNNRLNQTVYFCKCDCLSICKVTGSCLQSGSTKSCGCWHSDISSEVMTKYSTGRSGKDHPCYKHEMSDIERHQRRLGKTKFSREVYARDDYTCQKCKIRKSGNNIKLHAHHIYSYKDNIEIAEDINNGITFCQRCHEKFHSKYGQTYTNKDNTEEYIGRKIDYIPLIKTIQFYQSSFHYLI